MICMESMENDPSFCDELYSLNSYMLNKLFV